MYVQRLVHSYHYTQFCQAKLRWEGIFCNQSMLRVRYNTIIPSYNVKAAL